MTITSRLRALLGLDFDFDVQLRGDALSAIDARFLVGARPTEEDLPALRDAGVTHVVSCLEADALPNVRFLGSHFTTHSVEIRDAMDRDIASSFPGVFAFDATAGDDARVLVHCEAGVSRSATVAAALLMHRDGVTFFDAFATLRAGRPGVLPNIGFASQLQRLEHRGEGRAGQSPCSLSRYLREVCHAPVDADLLESALARHDHSAPDALRALFGGEIPRVVQGVRL